MKRTRRPIPLWFPKRLLADGWWLVPPSGEPALVLPFRLKTAPQEPSYEP